MAFTLPDLPYARTALDPTISAETLDTHHGKHHATYVAKLNDLVAGTEFESMALEAVIASAPPGPLFNNAAQHWNHSFYWKSMHPDGGGSPSGALAEAMDSSFGSVAAALDELASTAKNHFASGWVWLVTDHGSLSVIETADADLPMRHGLTALLTIDVWEHAYYLDHRNKRADYVEGFLANLVNWDFAAENFAAATGSPV